MEKTELKKNKKTNISKKDKYITQQHDILNKINEIIGLNKDNNTFYLYDLENDLEKKEKILALSDDIKIYFSASTWGFYTSDKCRGNHVLLCKNVFKALDLTIISTSQFIIRDNIKIQTTKYKIGTFST